MELRRAVIENYRAITRLELDLHPRMNVLFGGNGKGKTSVLNAVAVGLGSLVTMLPGASSIAFRQRDRRGGEPARVELETTDGTKWDRTRGGPRRLGRLDALRIHIESIVYADAVERDPLPLPIVAFYDSDRTVDPDRRLGAWPPKSTRFAALDGALSPRPDFRSFFAWFAAKEREEAAARRERSDLGYRLPELEAVRRAVAAAVPGVSDPTTAGRPPRFCVSVAEESETRRLALDQVGGGDRLLLALVADLARRMALANPHFPQLGRDPLEAEAVVLLDEVELHLHPSREQRVLPDLMRTFPNTQFLVTTNSPQVLTTVEADSLIELEREDGEIVAGGVVAPTFGAEAARVLTGVMKVDQRPPENDFARGLREYNSLNAAGRGDREEAVALRRRLEAMSPRDRGLDGARMEMNRQSVLRRLARTPGPQSVSGPPAQA